MRERHYFRLILGKKHSYASDCFAGGFVGSDWFADEDLTGKFPERFREFNTEYIPKFLEKNPEIGDEIVGAMEEAFEFFANPLISSSIGMAVSLFFGALISLLTGLALKKNRPA